MKTANKHYRITQKGLAKLKLVPSESSTGTLKDLESDTGPEKRVLRYLRSIDERLDRLEKAVVRLAEVSNARFGGLESRMVVLEARLTAFEE